MPSCGERESELWLDIRKTEISVTTGAGEGNLLWVWDNMDKETKL